jgi:hypothetical protein
VCVEDLAAPVIIAELKDRDLAIGRGASKKTPEIWR